METLRGAPKGNSGGTSHKTWNGTHCQAQVRSGSVNSSNLIL